MRQLLSTALVALVVGALAGATVGAVAQQPTADEPFIPAGVNADTVDGRHAVGATNKSKVRANKLVATNRTGFLPPNIVKAKWGLITGKPPFLADGQLDWGELADMPAGFSDGVDDIGPTYASEVVANETTPLAAGASRTILVWFDGNIDVVYNLIPTTNYGHLTLAYEFYRVDSQIIHIAIVKNVGTEPATFKVRALVFSEGITPAALSKAVKTANVVVKKGKHVPR